MPTKKPTTKKSAASTTAPLDIAQIRAAAQEALRDLKTGDASNARKVLIKTVNPWFYQSYPQYARDLDNALAHTAARWHAEEATRQIEQGNPQAARDLLEDEVLPWLVAHDPTAKPAKTKDATAPSSSAGVLGVGDVPIETGVPAAPAPSLRDLLLAQSDAHQLLPFNPSAALQKKILADGLVPNSAEFDVSEDGATFVAQRAEHLLTGEVRVYYADRKNVGDVKVVTRDAVPALNAPFKGGNRITQVFGARPEYYAQFHLAGHEGADMVPQDGDREIHAIEEGTVLKAIDVPGDRKTNAYGIYVVIFNAANRRLWYYCHMLENRVAVKQAVRRGDVLGRMGGTGNVNGDHLHLNIKLLDAASLPLTPNNGFKGWSDPLPALNALNAADATTPLRDALLKQAGQRQSIAFNTAAALQKQIFADGFLPNSAEFNLEAQGQAYVAERAENINTGAVRVDYAPTSNFGDVKFEER